jgi:predicted transposase YbfD/YdcC
MVDADPGRLETREAHLVTDLTGLPEQHPWPGLAGVGKITATREDKGTGPVPRQARYYRLSRVRTPQEFLDTGRAHWTIENALPGVLDVVRQEDQARARQEHAPTHLAILRRLALNTSKANQDKGSQRLKCKRAGWDHRFLRKLMTQC